MAVRSCPDGSYWRRASSSWHWARRWCRFGGTSVGARLGLACTTIDELVDGKPDFGAKGTPDSLQPPDVTTDPISGKVTGKVCQVANW